MKKTETGQKLKRLYYQYSPALIELLNRNELLKAYAVDRIIEVSALINEHLYGKGIGEADYGYVRDVINESLQVLRKLSPHYGGASFVEGVFDAGITAFLSDESLTEISTLINQFLKELSGQ